MSISPTRLLTTGVRQEGNGGQSGSRLTSVEVVSLDGTSLPCTPTLPQLPTVRDGHTQDGNTICGGVGSVVRVSCLTLSGDEGWVESHTLKYRRRRHSSWMSPSGILLMGGDWNVTSTELLSSTDSTTMNRFTLEYDTE